MVTAFFFLTDQADLRNSTNDESFHLSVSHLILIRFGLGSYIVLKTIQNEFIF
jgi:hypothetical protein